MSPTKPPTPEEIQRYRDRQAWFTWISAPLTLGILAQLVFPDIYRQFIPHPAFDRVYIVGLIAFCIFNVVALARIQKIRSKITRLAHDNAMRICPKCFHPADRTMGNDFQCTEYGDWYSISQVRKYLSRYPSNIRPPKPLRKGDADA